MNQLLSSVSCIYNSSILLETYCTSLARSTIVTSPSPSISAATFCTGVSVLSPRSASESSERSDISMTLSALRSPFLQSESYGCLPEYSVCTYDISEFVLNSSSTVLTTSYILYSWYPLTLTFKCTVSKIWPLILDFWGIPETEYIIPSGIPRSSMNSSLSRALASVRYF